MTATKQRSAPVERANPGLERIAALPIDDHDRPRWTDQYLSPNQRRVEPRTAWALALDRMDYRPSRKAVALRLHLAVLGKQDGNRVWIGAETMASKLGASPTTVRDVYADLEFLGWLADTGDKIGKAKVYRLAWPAGDANEHSRGLVCGTQLTRRYFSREHPDGREVPIAQLCRRPAGWGTERAFGPCAKHSANVTQLVVDDGLPSSSTDGRPSSTGASSRHSLMARPSVSGGEVVREDACLKSLEAATAGGVL
jgi:hypothetical protein